MIVSKVKWSKKLNLDLKVKLRGAVKESGGLVIFCGEDFTVMIEGEFFPPSFSLSAITPTFPFT